MSRCASCSDTCGQASAQTAGPGRGGSLLLEDDHGVCGEGDGGGGLMTPFAEDAENRTKWPLSELL